MIWLLEQFFQIRYKILNIGSLNIRPQTTLTDGLFYLLKIVMQNLLHTLNLVTFYLCLAVVGWNFEHFCIFRNQPQEWDQTDRVELVTVGDCLLMDIWTCFSRLRSWLEQYLHNCVTCATNQSQAQPGTSSHWLRPDVILQTNSHTWSAFIYCFR